MVKTLLETDRHIYECIQSELLRQVNQLEMIASENFASRAVMEAEGSVLMNKYAEGYPGRRYYAGCEFVDNVENIAIERLNLLFGSEYANVQPHSGSQANMAVYFGVLNHGDTILTMNLAHGGHLTHGSPVNFSGKFYKVIHYGVKRETGYIDYEQIEELAMKHRPRLIVAGASSYPRTIDFMRFKAAADSVNAYLMVDMAHIAGLVATGIHPSPIPFSDFVTSTTHKTLRGPRGGFILTREKYAKIIDSQVFPGIQGGPHMNIIAAKAVAFKEALAPEFKTYQQNIVANAKALAETLIENGFKLVSGGTDNHLVLVDLTDNGITGAEAEEALEKAGITVNKNAIPFDTKPPRITSGIRIGTPAVTTRGLGTEDIREVGGYISEILKDHKNDGLIRSIRLKITKICEKYPIYP